MNKLRQLVTSERGFALVLALGVTVVLSMTVVTVIEATSANQRTSAQTKNRMSAYDLAEAGLNNAFSILNYWDDTTAKNNAMDPTLLHPQPAAANCAATNSCSPFVANYDGGTATYYGNLDTNTSTWTITSIGQVRNPFGGQDSTRTLTSTVHVNWNTTQPRNAAAWNYIFAKNTSNATTCDVIIDGSVNEDAPLWVQGNLCLQQSSHIDENVAADPIDLTVVGKLVISDSARVGQSGAKITSAHIGGGCTTLVTLSTHTCSSTTDQYFVKTSSAVSPIALPTADFATWYNDANPGPKHPCDAATKSGPVPTFDGDTVRNNSVSPSFNLTPTTSYTCKGVDSTGNVVGELSWNATTRTLTVKGVVFIDGSAYTDNNQVNTYNGSASLYLSGTFTISNSTTMCSNTTCDFSTWNPNTEMLMLVVDGNDGTGLGAKMFDGAKFQGGMYATNGVKWYGSSHEEGPIVAGTVRFSDSSTLHALPTITTLPLGAPSNPNVHAVPGPPVFATG